MIPRFRGQCQGGARGLGPKRDAGGMPRPTGAAQVVHSSGPMYLRDGLRPYAPRGTRDGTPGRLALRVVAESRRDCPGQRRTAERLRQRMGGSGRESEQRSSQKCPATSDNPSVSLRLTAPFTQGSLGDEGCGLPRRFAPRNDSPDPSSFRGGPTGRRGNPSFLRWTGVRSAVPRAWPPPTKFRPEIWGVGQVVGPYGSDVGRTGQFKM